MTIVAVLAALIALGLFGVLLGRFNPATGYRRKTLIRLAVLAVIGVGAVLWAGFYRAPAATPSGVYETPL